jgi:hypothetical protein
MTRTERLLIKARRINDRLAIAVLEGGRTWTPDPETPMLTARLSPRVAQLRVAA